MSNFMFFLAKANTNTVFNCDDQLGDVIGIVGFVLKVIQVIVPILLILWGSIDLIKSVVAGKEEDIKKNQKTLLKRIISAVIVFLIPFLVSIILGLIGSDDWKDCWNDNKNNGIINVEDNDL
jgi:H+/gluconate symporter-like permease